MFFYKLKFYINMMSKNKSILILIPSFLPYIGGAEIFLINLLDQIKNSHKIIILTPKFNSRLKSFEKYKNANIIRLGIGQKKLDWYIFPILGLFWGFKNRHKYDLVYSVLENQNAILGSFLKYFFNKDHYLTLQSGDSVQDIHQRVKYFYPIYQNIFKTADKIHSISYHLIKRAKYLGFCGEFKIIHNGVDLANFKNLQVNYDLEKKVNLFTTSRLVKKNGIDITIKALNNLPNNIYLHIFGEGPLKNILNNLVNQLNLSNRIFFYGYKTHTEIIKIIQQFENIFFIRNSRNEGFGNSFIEAMALGIPVIASNVDAIPEYIQNLKNGFLIGQNNPSETTKTILNILMNYENLQLIIENGIKTANSHKWSDITLEVEQFLF